MSGAERTRLYRLRQSAGQIVVPVTVGEDLIERLIEAGFLAAHLADSRESVRAAVERFHASLRLASVGPV